MSDEVGQAEEVAQFLGMDKKARREAWVKEQIKKVKSGEQVYYICLMATQERIGMGLCNGTIPPERAKKGLLTCTPECQADRRRIRRWELSADKCRYCGHGLPQKERRAKLRGAQIGEEKLCK